MDQGLKWFEGSNTSGLKCFKSEHGLRTLKIQDSMIQKIKIQGFKSFWDEGK